MDQFVVIVAGGSGSRMKSKLPKQFIEIGGLPILMHTLNQFLSFSETLQIILVLPDNEIVSWKLLCQKHQFNVARIKIVNGGASRYLSCKNGINSIHSENALVAIHDGVRPFVSHEIIKNGYSLAKEKGTAVCCIESKDSARLIDEDLTSNKALDRKRLRLIQTPQVFKLNILKKAYDSPELDIFTDDASVVETAGFKIELFDGNSKNIKITEPEDLHLAALFLKENSQSFEK